jgi:hypothetical protein
MEKTLVKARAEPNKRRKASWAPTLALVPALVFARPTGWRNAAFDQAVLGFTYQPGNNAVSLIAHWRQYCTLTIVDSWTAQPLHGRRVPHQTSGLLLKRQSADEILGPGLWRELYIAEWVAVARCRAAAVLAGHWVVYRVRWWACVFKDDKHEHRLEGKKALGQGGVPWL